MAKPNIKLDLKALKLNPQKAKEIAGKYGVVIVSGIVLVAAPVAAYVLADGMNGTLASDAAARAGKLNDLKAIGTAEVSLSLPGQEPFSQQNLVINQKLIDQYKQRLDSVSKQSVATRELAVKHNRKEREPFVGMRLAKGDPALKELPLTVFDRLEKEYARLLSSMGAGDPYPEADMVAELSRRRSQIIDAEFGAKTEGELTAEERASLGTKLADERLARSCEHARQFSFYADAASIGAPDKSRRTTKLKPIDLFLMQWNYWVAEDVLAALKAANGEKDVLQGPVKRILALSSTLQAPTAAAAPADGAPAGDGSEPPPAPPADDGSGAPAAEGDPAVAAAPTGEPINPDAPLPAADYSKSFTGRTTNQLFDIITCEVRLVVQTSAIPQVIDELSKRNFITVTDVRVRPVDSFVAAEEGFMYGAAPVSAVSLRLETIWLREWTGPFMPDDLRTRLNTSGSLLGAGTPGGGDAPAEGVDPNAAPTDAPQG
jgi:hypothetical protein